jgi:hypothetical protein
MKKFLTLFLLLSASLYSVAQNTNAATQNTNAPNQSVLQLKETEHDFSKIPQGKPVYYNFEVVNTGKEPLKLNDVHASCGCTTPEWSPEPIAPGATATIKVGYNAAAEGYFEKFITITYNTNQTEQLKIKGTVWKAPQGSAPANASVEFLKKQNL